MPSSAVKSRSSYSLLDQPAKVVSHTQPFVKKKKKKLITLSGIQICV